MIEIGPEDFKDVLVEKYALERRVARLEAENAALRAAIPPLPDAEKQ